MQFTMTENVKREQKVHIKWNKRILDDEFNPRPDEEDEGFWPSRDEDAAGYVFPENFDAEQAKAEKRMREWEQGIWCYVGVIAECQLLIPVGSNSFRMMKLESSGLWGIESDASSFIDEVFEEQKEELLAQLKTLAAGLDSAIVMS